jgi:zinc and cadmium transporter
MENLAIALLAALTVSAVSFIGVATFSLTGDRLKKVINLLLSLAAGAMLGNALLHLLPHSLENAKHNPPAIVQVVQPKPTDTAVKVEAPEHVDHADHDHDHDHDGAAHKDAPKDAHAGHDHDHDHDTAAHKDAPKDAHAGHDHDHDHDAAAHTDAAKDAHAGHNHDHSSLSVFALLLAGFLALFGLDLALLTRTHKDDECVKPLGYLVMLSDGLENFLDGLVIGAAFLVSIPAGIATTIAIFLHEVPMELGDYAVMRHSGFSRKKALLLNFASAMVNVVGVVLAFTLGSALPGFSSIATPFAAGAILYLAATGLLPQIRMQGTSKQKASYFTMTLLGVAVMALILLIE